jgi:hypothetical protein
LVVLINFGQDAAQKDFVFGNFFDQFGLATPELKSQFIVELEKLILLV